MEAVEEERKAIQGESKKVYVRLNPKELKALLIVKNVEFYRFL